MREKNKSLESLSKESGIIKMRTLLLKKAYIDNRHLPVKERKLLYKYYQEDKGISKEDLLVNTVQKTIPFKKMYKDGICDLGDGTYTKMMEFMDINYEDLEDDERKSKIARYKTYLNSFDPLLSFQFFFFNRKVNEEKLKERFIIPKRDDKFDEIRIESENILKSQAARGNNGIIKGKFLIIGAKCSSYEEAVNKFYGLDHFAKDMSELGSFAYFLDGYERLKILYEYFTESDNDFVFDFDECERLGKSEKDYIVPKWIDFRGKKEMKVPGSIGKSFYLSYSSAKISENFFKGLIKQNGNFSISIHLKSYRPNEAHKIVSNQLVQIQSIKIDEQQKAFRGGYDIDTLPTRLRKAENDGLEIMEALDSSDEKLFFMTIVVNVFGNDKSSLDNLYQYISSEVGQANCYLVDLINLQEQGFITGAPLLVNQLSKDEGRFLLSKHIAIMIPFITQELFMDGFSICYGLNLKSNNMILANRKQLPNPNGLILGIPGSGKSFAAKKEIIAVFMQSMDEIIICDPEGEYYPLIEALDGQVVKLANNSKAYLNPMDIQLSGVSKREAIQVKASFIITLMELVAGGELGLKNDEKGIVDDCVRKIYNEFFKHPSVEEMPTLSDLYLELMNYDPKLQNPDMDDKLCFEGKALAARMGNSLNMYVNGSQNYFNHRTNINSDNRLLCFDIRDLSSHLKDIGMLIVQDAVWHRVSKNRGSGISTWYYCDEFHLLLRDKQTADYSIEMWKRFRKWGGIPTGITQNAGDFFTNKDVEAIMGNSQFVLMFDMGKEKELIKNLFSISDKLAGHVVDARRGSGLLIFGSLKIPFYDNYPTDTKTYELMNTKPIYDEDYVDE